MPEKLIAAEVIKMLRDDAIARGMLDLAIVYGWTLIRLNQESIDEWLMSRGQVQGGQAA